MFVVGNVFIIFQTFPNPHASFPLLLSPCGLAHHPIHMAHSFRTVPTMDLISLIWFFLTSVKLFLSLKKSSIAVLWLTLMYCEETVKNLQLSKQNNINNTHTFSVRIKHGKCNCLKEQYVHKRLILILCAKAARIQNQWVPNYPSRHWSPILKLFWWLVGIERGTLECVSRRSRKT